MLQRGDQLLNLTFCAVHEEERQGMRRCRARLHRIYVKTRLQYNSVAATVIWNWKAVCRVK